MSEEHEIALNYVLSILPGREVGDTTSAHALTDVGQIRQQSLLLTLDKYESKAYS